MVETATNKLWAVGDLSDICNLSLAPASTKLSSVGKVMCVDFNTFAVIFVEQLV